MLDQVIEHLLEVPFAYLLGLFLVLDSDGLKVIDSHSLHLMEGWVVGSVNCVFPIDVTNAKEGVVCAMASGT